MAALSLLATGCPAPGVFPAVPATADLPVRIQALETQTRELTPGCVAALEKRFGRAWPRNHQGEPRGLEVRLKDSETECGTSSAGCTTGGGVFGITVSLNRSLFLGGAGDLHQTLCHELSHAYFRKFSDGYSSLPRWAREGSAVYLAAQTDTKVWTQVFKQLEAPWEAVNGLEGAHGFEDYFEDALAFEFLDQQVEGGAERALALVLEGRDIFDAIREVTGMDRAAFLQGARDHAVARLRALQGGLDPDIITARRELSQGAPRAEILRRLEKVLERAGVAIDAAGAVTGTVTPSAGYAMRVLADYKRFAPQTQPRALALFRALVSGTVPAEYYAREVGSVRYEYAGTLLGSGMALEALEQYFRVRREHAESPMLQLSSTMGIARSYFAAGEYAQAIRWLEPQRLDGTHVDEEIGYRLGLSYFYTCKLKKGHKLLERVAQGAATHVWVRAASAALRQIDSGAIHAPASCAP